MNKFALIALLAGTASAVEFNRWTQYRINLAQAAARDQMRAHMRDLPSNEVANGDVSENKELED